MKSDIEGPLSATEKSSSVSEYGRSATPIRKWVLHVADWIAVVVVVAVSQIILIPQPYSVSFIVTNPYIQQFHFQDSFDITRACVVLSTAVPVVIIIIWLGYFRRSLGDIHMAVLGLGMALSFCALFVSVFKQMALSLSPDFLGRCELDQADYDRSFNTGARLSYRLCKGSNTIRGVRFFPAFTTAIPSCALGYLSLFASLHLGVWIHPQVRRQLHNISPHYTVYRARPGQAMMSFIALLPFAAGMTFPALEAKYYGGGNGWGDACSILLGLVFAFWAHFTYCYDMPSALLTYMYE